MVLDDFKNISAAVDVDSSDNVNHNMCVSDDFGFETIKHYLSNMDELVNLMNSSYVDYINAKLKYDFKKDDYQTNTDWNKENALRENNGLSKVTNQNQRDSVINLKLKSLNVKVKSCEMKYKFYSKVFNFISNNFELLMGMYGVK